MGTGVFQRVKRPGCGVDHPPPSSAEVKDRQELHLYSPSGPSRPVIGGGGFTFYLHFLRFDVVSALWCASDQNVSAACIFKEFIQRLLLLLLLLLLRFAELTCQKLCLGCLPIKEQLGVFFPLKYRIKSLR
jgi:hypothetical protein